MFHLWRDRNILVEITRGVNHYCFSTGFTWWLISLWLCWVAGMMFRNDKITFGPILFFFNTLLVWLTLRLLEDVERLSGLLTCPCCWSGCAKPGRTLVTRWPLCSWRRASPPSVQSCQSSQSADPLRCYWEHTPALACKCMHRQSITRRIHFNRNLMVLQISASAT